MTAMTVSAWLADSSASPDSAVLLQYGAIGFIAMAALLAVKVLFGRLEHQYHERDKERERELERVLVRADRLEGELAKLNNSVRDSMNALTTANQAVAEAMTRMRRER